MSPETELDRAARAIDRGDRGEHRGGAVDLVAVVCERGRAAKIGDIDHLGAPGDRLRRPDVDSRDAGLQVVVV